MGVPLVYDDISSYIKLALAAALAGDSGARCLIQDKHRRKGLSGAFIQCQRLPEAILKSVSNVIV